MPFTFQYMQITCQYIAYKSYEDNGTISKISDSFFAGIKVLCAKENYDM